MGVGRLTTVELEPEDTAQRLTLPDPVTGERAEFFCLPLGENPSAYDSYLVLVEQPCRLLHIAMQSAGRDVGVAAHERCERRKFL